MSVWVVLKNEIPAAKMLLCRSPVMESETLIYKGGWIYSCMLKNLFKAFFTDSYLQHYHDRLYINLLGENKPYGQNDMIITPREYSTVKLGVELGSSYRSIESSTIRGHP